jgi:hypothetical protein
MEPVRLVSSAVNIMRSLLVSPISYINGALSRCKVRASAGKGKIHVQGYIHNSKHREMERVDAGREGDIHTYIHHAHELYKRSIIKL